MNEPLFETSSMGFKIKVYPNRIAYKPLLMGEVTIPISQVASVNLGNLMLQRVIVETTGGKSYKLNIGTGQKEKFRDAVYDAMKA